MPHRPLALQPPPRIISFFDQSSVREGRQKRLTREYAQMKQVHSATLEQAKAIFTIAINCLQHLHNLKEGSVSAEGLAESIENYKVDLGRYHKILLTELNSDSNSQLFSEQVLQDHKNKMVRAKNDGMVENIVEVLLSLRVNALQISPEQRPNLVSELIKNDIFMIRAHKGTGFLIDLMAMESVGLKHAVCSLISVVACTQQGVDYLTLFGNAVVRQIMDIVKLKLDECEDGTVAQRFCLAVLQKMSVKEQCTNQMFDANFAQWILSLIERSCKKEVHSFCLDFGSALLANIFHSAAVLEKLEKNPQLLYELLSKLIALLKEPLPTSVLIHLLICLSYLSKERFS